MRALRVLREARPQVRGRTRGVMAVMGGALWWWAAMRLAVRPEAGASWQGALAAGGWSLGLIPLHAVRTPVPAPPPGSEAGQPPAGAGPRWQRGHQ
jgi:hypothetical protein